MAEWAFWGLAPFLAAALISDTREMRIPNALALSSLLTGLLMHGAAEGYRGLLFALGGAGTGFAVMLLLHMAGAIGAGDVKLFAGIGAWAGIWFTIQIILYSVLAAAVIGWMLVMLKRQAGRRLRGAAGSLLAGFIPLRAPFKGSSNEPLRFPFMLAVVPGWLCAYMYF